MTSSRGSSLTCLPLVRMQRLGAPHLRTRLWSTSARSRNLVKIKRGMWRCDASRLLLESLEKTIYRDQCHLCSINVFIVSVVVLRRKAALNWLFNTFDTCKASRNHISTYFQINTDHMLTKQSQIQRHWIHYKYNSFRRIETMDVTTHGQCK